MRRGTILLLAAMTVMLLWLPGGYARGDPQQEEDPASSARTRASDRIELDGIRNGKIAFSQEGEMPSALDQAIETDEPVLVREPDIWAVNPNGSNPVQLTANSRDWDESPAWSPDGQRIAFVNKDPVADQPNLAGRIYVMNADGSNRIAISPPKGEGVDAPSWSPDGQRIAFSSVTTDCGIFVANADGSGTPKELQTPGFSGCAVGQEWSPDGTKMAFQGYAHDSGWADIYIMNISPEGNTSELRRLTDFRMDDRDPAWSPDGTEIAFTTNRDHQGEIYKIEVDSLRETRLTHSPLYDHEPTWSPDGERIAYVKQKLVRGTHASIYRMDSDGSNSTPVFEANGTYAYGPDWAPWSPAAQMETTMIGSPPPMALTTGGPATLLPAVALLLGSGIMTYVILRRI